MREITLLFYRKNIINENYSDIKLISKGFYSDSIIHDFLIRGKQVYLYIIIIICWTQEQSNKIRLGKQVAKDTKLHGHYIDYLSNSKQLEQKHIQKIPVNKRNKV